MILCHEESFFFDNFKFFILNFVKIFYCIINAAQHRAIVRTVVQVPKPTHSVLGIEMDKVKTIQTKIEDFVKHMSELLDIERDAELEFTQEELSAVPKPEEKSDSTKPPEYLVSHGQAQQEQCDTICNLKAISSSTGVSQTFLLAFVKIIFCMLVSLI